MKTAAFVLVLISLVLADISWYCVDNKFKSIRSHEYDANDKIKDIMKADPDTEAAKSIGEALDKCWEKLEDMYRKDFRDDVQGKRLAPGSVEHYPIYSRDIKTECMAEMKENFEKLAPQNQAKITEICEATDKYRDDTCKEIIQCLIQ